MRDQLTAAADRLTPPAAVEFRPMFGGACGYVDGRVFASLSDVGLALKLAPADQDDLLAVPGTERLRYEPDAPASKQYVVVPPVVRADPDALAGWVGRSLEYARSLPAPKPKRRKPS